MERFSDEAQRNGDKMLDGENKRLSREVAFLGYAVSVLALLCLVLGGSLVMMVEFEPHDNDVCVGQIHGMNQLRLQTEAQLRECTDARMALQLSCDVLVEAANQCACEPTSPRDIEAIVYHRHYDRKVRR